MTKHTDTPQHTHLWELTVCDCGEWKVTKENTPDPLTDMFEDMGIKVVDVTPNKHTDTSNCCSSTTHIYSSGEGTNHYVCDSCGQACDLEKWQTTHTDTDELRELLAVNGLPHDHIEGDLLLSIITLYTANREREARIDELERVPMYRNEAWQETIGNRITALQNQTSKENTHDQL